MALLSAYHAYPMRWIAAVALFLVITSGARADAPDDQYLDVYNQILQADNLQQGGQSPAAAAKYQEALSNLKKLQASHPSWNPDVVHFRLEYLAEQLQLLQKFVPPANTAAPPSAASAAPPPASLPQQVAGLQEQIRALISANTQLEDKLKEALSVQPAAVSPRELAKAQEQILALQKEKDLLSVALDQAKAAGAAKPQAAATKQAQELAEAKQALAEEKARSNSRAVEAQAQIAALETSAADARKKLEALQASQTSQNASAEALKQLAQERDQLKDELAARTKDLADAEAHRDTDVLAARAQLKQAQEQRDQLQKKLDATMSELAVKTSAPAPAPTAVENPASAPAAVENPAATAEVERLRARLAVLEAQAVPYTPEELAVLNKTPSQPPAALPAAHPTNHVAHSSKELPPGAGELMKEATRASMEHDYAAAEGKYNEILRQDENNVYVLAHLANAQYAQGHLPDCEKTVLRALAQDPDDPASLYLLGVLRYRQQRLDDALDALSRSATYNPTNAGTQNYLGCVLADKGQRAAAETALRKALQADPEYADAHFNLAFVYATEKPPSLELARWHYKRALDLGHAKSPDLEKVLEPDKP